MADDKPRCPDDGTCHHECVNGCFRVMCCAPLPNPLFDHNLGWPPSCVEVYGRPKDYVF